MPEGTIVTDAHVEQVMQDVACPGCEYNLRGLHGPVVRCPECGHACDIAKLVSVRWTKPWYRAPKFNRLVLPVAWVVFAGLGLWIGTTALIIGGHRVPVLIGVAWAGVLIGWLSCFIPAFRVFDSMRGVWLALLAHVVFFAYLVSGVVAVVLFINVVFLTTRGQLAATIVPAIIVVVALGIGYIARRVERWIAEQCIREYLRRRGAVVTVV